MLAEDGVYVFANPRQKIATVNMLRFDTQRHEFIEKIGLFAVKHPAFIAIQGENFIENPRKLVYFPPMPRVVFDRFVVGLIRSFPPFSSANL